jgi:hypothetical protein
VIVHHKKLIELVFVVPEHMLQSLDSQGEMGVRESKIQDSSMRLTMTKYELSEVSVVRNQDTPLAVRNREDITIL